MQNFRICLFSILLFAGLKSQAQQEEVIKNYIETYRDIAIAEMHRTGIPAAIKLAQGIHETAAGTSDLVRRSNNHFGIKCKSNWTGESVKHTDDAPNECFRKYADPLDSYRDHSDFLKGSKRYASLFTLDPLDFAGWANGLKKAGYATNPKYPQIIIKLVEKYQLQDYTLIAMGKMEPKEAILAKNNDVAAPADAAVAVSHPVSNVISKPAKTYPSGEFKINDTRVVYAQAGISYLSLAQQYNVSLKRIFEFNELPELETVYQDQLIFLQRKRKSGAAEIHVVKAGETLQDIAQEQGIRMESLLEYNHLQPHMQPADGEQLYLRHKAPAMPRLSQKVIAANSAIGTNTVNQF